MSIATNRGFVVGKEYRIKEGRGEGTVVTFLADDGTDCPKFAVPYDYDYDEWSFIDLERLGPVDAAAPVAVHINLNGNSTTIVVQRNLSADQVAAVLKAINAA